MKKIALSLAMIVVVVSAAIGATHAYFSDTETSNENTFAAGTLDLTVNGGNQNVSYTFNNMEPVHSQPNLTWKLKNVGTVNGRLNLSNISVTSNDNGCNEPESSAGDSTCDDNEGELSGILNLRLMKDLNCDGWLQAGDVVLYQGPANGLAAAYSPNISLNAGAESCVNVLINWWSTADDNKAQSDDMTLNMSFNLDQLP